MIHNKFRYILTLVALFAMTAGAWADDISVTTEDFGKVICTDGSIYATVEDATAASKTAAAKIFFIDNVNKKGLALALADESGTMDWSTAKTTAAAHTPAVTGGTWKLPTMDEWTNMREAAKNYQNDEHNGHSTFKNMANLTQRYWVNTEDEYDSNNAYYYIPYSGGQYGFSTESKTNNNSCYVRACLEFNIASADGPEVTWNATTKQATFTMPAYDVELTPEYYPGMLTLGSGAIEGGKLEIVGLVGTTSFTAPSEWDHNSTKLTSGHFEGFKSVTEEEAKAWPGVPATGKVALFYNYDETGQKWDMIYFKNGAFDRIYKGEPQQLATIYNLTDFSFSVFYTTGMQMPAGFEQDEEGNIYVEPGTEFQVKAVPNEGYRLVSLTDGTNDIEVDADGIATITMPAEYADLTLTATFSNEYNVALNAEGLSDEEAANWKAATGTDQPAAFPLENVKYGTEVKVTYTGTKKVLGVKAEKKAAAKPVATLTAAPTPYGYICVYDEIFETLGTAEGGTLMYKVTTTGVKPTSTEGFSTSNPRGVQNEPSFKNFIWYYIKGDDTHSDSEIFGPIEINVWLM